MVGSEDKKADRHKEKQTIADLEMQSLQIDYLRAKEKGAGSDLPYVVKLVVQKTGQCFPLTGRRVKIGRGPSNQVVIPDDSFASRNHAWIVYEEGEFWIEDLGSTNGTLLNGHPVMKRHCLSAGDKIRVGHTELSFEMEKN